MILWDHYKISSYLGSVTAKGTLSATVNVYASAGVSYYMADGQKTFKLKGDAGMKADLTASGALELRVPLGSFGFSPVPGFYIGFEPDLVVGAEATVKFAAEASAAIGFSYVSENKGSGGGFRESSGFQNLCSSPTFKLKASVEGKIYMCIDFVPHVRILGSVVVAELNAEVDFAVTFTAEEFDYEKQIGVKPKSIHGCSTHYPFDGTISFKPGAKIKFLGIDDLEYKMDFFELSGDIMAGYYAPEYDDLGFIKDCPHDKYRVTASIKDSDAPDQTIYLTTNGTTRENIGKTDSSGVCIFYLDPGRYRLLAQDGDTAYDSGTFTISSDAVEVILTTTTTSPGSTTPSESTTPTTIASGTCGDDLTWVLTDDGTLTISGTGEMSDYSYSYSYNSDGTVTLDVSTPWNNYRESIKKVVIENGVTSIGSSAFYCCTSLTSITIPNSITSIGYGTFRGCTGLTSITIPDSVTSIGNYAFDGCISLTSIYYSGTEAQWNAITIYSGNTYLTNATIHYNSTGPESTAQAA